jgi:hypothetical protein
MSRDDLPQFTRREAERAMLRLLRDNDLPEPDDILDHEDGGIVCLWHEPKVAIVVDVSDAPTSPSDAPTSLSRGMGRGQAREGERADEQSEVA